MPQRDRSVTLYVQLLEAGLNYLEAGKQESAILNLPVEQRRLIIRRRPAFDTGNGQTKITP
jgi:hypothetical protein